MRITVWRYGVASLAVYALVFQSIVLASLPLHPGTGAVLCVSDKVPGDDYPGQPVDRHSGFCLFHCLATAGYPPASMASALALVTAARSLPVASLLPLRHTQRLRDRPPARAPPAHVFLA